MDGTKVNAMAADLASEDEVLKLAENIEQKFGGAYNFSFRRRERAADDF